jgi:hypothetical protein
VNETAERIMRANPVPGVVLADDEFVDSAALFAAIVSRRDAMTHTRTDKREAVTVARAPWYRRSAVVALSAALAILVAVGATALLFGRSGEAPADIAPTTTLPPTTEAAPMPDDSTVSLTSTDVSDIRTVPEVTATDLVRIERVGVPYLDTVLGGGRIWDVALGGPGLVAVGEVETPEDEDSVWGGPSRDAFVVVSSDGRSWERVDDPEVFGGDDRDELHRVWGSSIGLIAQGIDAQAQYPTVWYASDDGIEWSLITDEDLYDAWERQYRYGESWFEFSERELGEGEFGWVAALYRDVGEHKWDCSDYPSRSCESPELQELLISDNGISWDLTDASIEDLAEPPREVLAAPSLDEWNSGDSGYLWNLASDGERIVAVRYWSDAMVGISTDSGRTWIHVDPGLFAGDEQDSYESFAGESGLWTVDVVRLDDVYVIVGDAYNAPGVWILEWAE